jgi:hypothetical protein
LRVLPRSGKPCAARPSVTFCTPLGWCAAMGVGVRRDGFSRCYARQRRRCQSRPCGMATTASGSRNGASPGMATGVAEATAAWTTAAMESRVARADATRMMRVARAWTSTTARHPPQRPAAPSARP